jgi:HEAT repeats/Tetratricopeptide repeat/Cytochrome c554 and c-prime
VLAEGAWEDSLPPRSKFAGAAACADCHSKNHARWSRGWHARALAKAGPGAVVGDFGGVHFAGASSEAWMTRKGDAFSMRTRDREGRLADHVVEWVIGGKRMQDPITLLADGRWQVLPVYFHVTGGSWVDYNEAKQGVVGPDHPFFWTNFRRTANRECLDCHSTGLQVRYDRASHRWYTDFTDPGVACESCHGPGARHAETKTKGDSVQPRKAGAELGLAICGQCHGPRNPLFPILDAAHRFRPGDRYEDFYQPFVVTDGRQRSADFFADGRPSSSSFEYTALLQSACQRKGGATCLSCHTAPHQEHGPDDLKPGGRDGGCRSWHAGVQHTHHASPEAQRCVACHMPRVLSGVLDKFADHALDVPVPENTRRHGIPNACNECHSQRSPEDMSRALRGWWPGAAARQARRLRLADAFDDHASKGSLPALEAVLADTSEAPTLRGAAALLLAGRFPRQAQRPLVAALSDPDPVLRARLANAVGLAPSRESVAALAPLVSDANLEVRHAASVTLGSLGTPEGRAALERLAADPATQGLVRPHVLLAAYAARQSDFAQAARRLEEALDLQPYQADVLVMLAQVRDRLGDKAGARAALEEALRFDPQSAVAQQGLRAIGAR